MSVYLLNVENSFSLFDIIYKWRIRTECAAFTAYSHFWERTL